MIYYEEKDFNIGDTVCFLAQIRCNYTDDGDYEIIRPGRGVIIEDKIKEISSQNIIEFFLENSGPYYMGEIYKSKLDLISDLHSELQVMKIENGIDLEHVRFINDQ